MVHVFIDTNVFLHFISFTEFDWQEIVGDSSYEFVIPLTVVSELDNKKTHPTKKIADKAKVTLEKFHKVMEGERIGDLKVVLLATRPKNEVYTAYDLSINEPDDRILAAIIDYQTEHKKVLISNDTAIRIRAKQLGLEYKTVPEKYALTETTLEEKEIKELKNQLKQAKDKTPNIRLNFNNESNITKFGKRDYDESITEEVYVARESYNIKLQPYDLNDPFIHLEPNGIESARKYNKELSEYKLDCTKFFKDSYYHTLYTLKTYELRLIIDNKGGSIPAENVEIKLDFPEDINANIEKLETPQTPKIPRRDNVSSEYLGFIPRRENYLELNYSKIFNSQEKQSIIYTCKDIKHHKEIELDPIYVTFKSSVHSFTINYIILADNIGQKMEGTLNVVIE